MSRSMPKVLVVDDEPHNREIIAEYLEDESYELVMAEDGEVAWTLLQDDPHSFDVVLLDIMMPKMDGMELLALIKDHTILKDLPVILQTARGGSADVVKGIEAGAFYYLTKPFDDELLCSIVKTAIDDHCKYRELESELKRCARAFGMLQNGTFHYRTLLEARNLTFYLSQACPNPEKVALGLSELLINAVEHGNLGITYAQKTRLVSSETWSSTVENMLQQPEFIDKQVQVDFSRNENEIRFVITDQGEGFDWRPYMEIDPARGMDNHGRGIAMAGIMSFDNIEYQGKGNIVVATLAC